MRRRELTQALEGRGDQTPMVFCWSRNREMSRTVMHARATQATRGVVREPTEIYGAGKQAIVARLRHLRQQLEDGMAPESWTDLEVPAFILLADVCDVLRLTSAEKDAVLGEDGRQRQDAMLDERIRPRPLNERQLHALAEVERRGRLANGDLHQVFPHLSAEAIRLDLSDLVRRGLMRRHGRCRGTTYTLA